MIDRVTRQNLDFLLKGSYQFYSFCRLAQHFSWMWPQGYQHRLSASFPCSGDEFFNDIFMSKVDPIEYPYGSHRILCFKLFYVSVYNQLRLSKIELQK